MFIPASNILERCCIGTGGTGTIDKEKFTGQIITFMNVGSAEPAGKAIHKTLFNYYGSHKTITHDKCVPFGWRIRIDGNISRTGFQYADQRDDTLDGLMGIYPDPITLFYAVFKKAILAF